MSCGKGFPVDVLHQSLGDLIAAAGIAIAAARNRDHRDLRRVGGGRAVENLCERGDWSAGLVAEEAGHADAAGHAEQPAQGDLVSRVERIARHLPRGELVVHVLIERKRAILHEPHGTDGGDEFRE